MDYNTAKEIAIGICTKLQPFCERINIAGSIRRQKPQVKDIEVIAQPKEVRAQRYDLFGAELPMLVSVVPEFIEVVQSIGTVVKGKATGRYMQINLPQGINLDLFMPQPEDYFRQYAIRTGSANYAHMVIAQGWLKKGWCGVSGLGLRRQGDCEGKKKPDGKTEWKLTRPNAEVPPEWKDELDFFSWLGVPWIKPHLREM